MTTADIQIPQDFILKRTGFRSYEGSYNGKRIRVRCEQLIQKGSFPANKRQKRNDTWRVTLDTEHVGDAPSLREARVLAYSACAGIQEKRTASIRLSAGARVWYHGDTSKRTSFDDQNFQNSSNWNAMGPGIYFTSSKQQAKGYAYPSGFVYSATVSGKFATDEQRPTRQEIRKFLQLLSPERRETLFSNWDENPSRAQAMVEKMALEQDFGSCFADLGRQAGLDFGTTGREWCALMTSLGYSGLVHAFPSGVEHLIVWNPKAIQVIREEPIDSTSLVTWDDKVTEQAPDATKQASVKLSAAPKWKEVGVPLPSVVEQVRQHVGPGVFFSMTALEKLGINPQSDYNTPLGIYAYPLNEEFFNLWQYGKLPFAGDKPFINVFRVTENGIVDVRDSYTNAQFAEDLEEIRQWYTTTIMQTGEKLAENIRVLGEELKEAMLDLPRGSQYVDRLAAVLTQMQKLVAQDADIGARHQVENALDDIFEELDDISSGSKSDSLRNKLNKLFIYSRVEKPSTSELERIIQDGIKDAKEGTAFAKLWNVTRLVSKTSARWNSLLRYLGYEGITDLHGTGLIHPSEPTQAVFLSMKPIQMLGRWSNPQREAKQTKVQKDIRRYIRLLDSDRFQEARRMYDTGYFDPFLVEQEIAHRFIYGGTSAQVIKSFYEAFAGAPMMARFNNRVRNAVSEAVFRAKSGHSPIINVEGLAGVQDAEVRKLLTDLKVLEAESRTPSLPATASVRLLASRLTTISKTASYIHFETTQDSGAGGTLRFEQLHVGDKVRLRSTFKPKLEDATEALTLLSDHVGHVMGVDYNGGTVDVELNFERFRLPSSALSVVLSPDDPRA